MNHWSLLSIAIVCEVIATSCLKSTENFTRLGPSIVVIVGYMLAFYFLTLTLKTMPVGVAYAIWSAVGIVLITLIGWIFLGQSLDIPAVIGLSLIVIGVVIINGFSSSLHH